ncbi:MAG: alpha/beta hydrolase family protein [Aureliella sp.]
MSHPLDRRRTIALGLSALFSLAVTSSPAMAQKKFEPNYEESKIGKVELPPLLQGTMPDDPAEAKKVWEPRRKELLEMFTEQMFGRAPDEKVKVSWKKVESGEAFDGAARRQQLRVTLSTDAGELPIDLLLYTPASAKSPVPTFLGLNFRGNHAETNDPAVRLPSSWVPDDPKNHTTENHRATEKGRGSQAHRLPVEMIVKEGFGVATAYYGDIDPDFDDNFQNGLHALFPSYRPDDQHPDRWGSIAAWAYGLSRLLDVLEEVDEVDDQQVIVFGHSRLGKTSLWAGANDTRFAGVISNDSGAGGAALSKRIFGETVARLNTSFPHWFCRNFRKYNENEAALPFDQHELLALTAPRLLHVGSATEDLWADPRGEFEATLAASPIFEKLGVGGLKTKTMPAPGHASIGHVSYHLRIGPHDLAPWDWEQYLKSAKLLKK